jgi:glycosyltransferase involved in cell wall biosynthesis
VRSVVTFHDLIWARHPETMDAFSRRAMRATALPSVRRADRVLTAASVVRDELTATVGIDASRIDVVPHGVRVPSVAPDTGIAARLGIAGRPVVLCVAQKRSHKNLAALVRVLPALPDGAVLVLPGAPTPYEDKLRELAGSLGVAERLVLPAWVSEAELEGLYAVATIFALPSFDEGFGLPVLEAMVRGVPVACSDATSLPEVAGDAAERFDPHSDAGIAAALGRLLGDPGRRQELSRRGSERAAGFTWDRSARLTLDAYARA